MSGNCMLTTKSFGHNRVTGYENKQEAGGTGSFDMGGLNSRNIQSEGRGEGLSNF